MGGFPARCGPDGLGCPFSASLVLSGAFDCPVGWVELHAGLDLMPGLPVMGEDEGLCA